MRSVATWILLAACVVLPASNAVASDLAALERSVVRIINYSQRGDWASPWDRLQVMESSGSGFVIDGALILTNAHVVSDSRLLLVQFHDDPQPYEAEVVHIAHDCDLALIRPLDPTPLKQAPALSFGPSPPLGSPVDTLGYPAGGLRVSSTRGVVSRIEPQLYVHSGVDVHVAVQTDAAINAGASGGPVVQDGRVVGVAFQVHYELENAGFFIANEVVQRFLLDVEDGTYDGYPELGIYTSSMHNPAIRAHAGMADDETGVRVFRVIPGTSAETGLREGDVIIGVNDLPVANDGTVEDGGSRTPFGMLIDRLQIGSTVKLHVIREGPRLDVEVPLRGFAARDFQSNVYDRLPRYYVYAGLVFVALDREVLRTFDADWYRNAPKSLLREYLLRPAKEPHLYSQERVLLLRRLKHPVNSEMAWYRDSVVERVNGQPVTSLDDLVKILEAHEGEFHLFEFATAGRVGVLDRRKAEEANDEILEAYGIDPDRNL